MTAWKFRLTYIFTDNEIAVSVTILLLQVLKMQCISVDAYREETGE